ncbi:MAG TPA: T9SS type A sorting domain-containing protein, partial [Flavobacteriales bacterium]|nr:T9SS type A sorting domain-containing protein [Flavobacteriales bacterium]
KFQNTGPNGAYTTGNQYIQSTTAANGAAIFASDSANTDWSVTPITIVASPVNWEASLVSPLLDLSASPYVEIEFQQRSRFCCDQSPFFLEVSTDGGFSWPTAFLTNPGLPLNQGAPGVGGGPVTTETRVFNLTNAIAADATQVKFRFRHNSESGTSHYFWQVDDIEIRMLGEYDLRLVSAANTSFDLAAAATYDSLAYTIFSYNQLRPLGLNMTVLNNGSMAQTDAVANFTVMEGSNTVLDQDQPVADFLPGEERLIFVDPGFTPPAVAGTYNVDYSITSSATDPVADNTGSSSFKVDANRYARDGGSATGYDDGDGAGGVFIFGNMFYAANAADLYSISVLLGAQSVVGDLVVGQVRATDEDFSLIASTEEIQITSAMLNGTGGTNFTELLFSSPFTVEAGTDYLISIEVYGSARIGVSGTSEAQTSFIYYNSPTQGEDWFYTTTTPMVRMNFDATVGIEERDLSNGVALGQNIPNPVNETTTIPYVLEVPAAVTFEVRDLSGKLVQSINQGKRGAGSYRMTMDTGSLSEGAYTYTIIAGAVKQTKRMTVVR